MHNWPQRYVGEAEFVAGRPGLAFQGTIENLELRLEVL